MADSTKNGSKTKPLKLGFVSWTQNAGNMPIFASRTPPSSKPSTRLWTPSTTTAFSGSPELTHDNTINREPVDTSKLNQMFGTQSKPIGRAYPLQSRHRTSQKPTADTLRSSGHIVTNMDSLVSAPVPAHSSRSGTSVIKYRMTENTEELQIKGRLKTVNIFYECITFMQEYNGKSLEELRWEDYLNDPNKSKTNNKLAAIISATDQITNTNSGTSNRKYREVSDTDVAMIYGRLMDIDTKLHCITGMWEYQGKSLEELRFEDYLVNRKGSKRGVFGFGFECPVADPNIFFKSPFSSENSKWGFLSSNYHTSQPPTQKIESPIPSSISPNANLFEEAILPNGETVFDLNSLAAIKAFPSILTKTEPSYTRRIRNKSLTPIKSKTASTSEKPSGRRYSEGATASKRTSQQKTAPFCFQPQVLAVASLNLAPSPEPNLDGTLSKLVSLKISSEDYEKMEPKTFTNSTFPDLDMNSTRCKSVISKQHLKKDSTNQSPPENGGKSHRAGIVLKQERCYTIPALDVLPFYLTKDGRCVVREFIVGHTDYGSVCFRGPIDVAGLNLDEIVTFRYKEVVVYPDDKNKPPLGFGLNRRAQVTIKKIWPHDKVTHEPITDVGCLEGLDYVGKLQRLCDKHGARFIEYQPETGSWVFEVEHF